MTVLKNLGLTNIAALAGIIIASFTTAQNVPTSTAVNLALPTNAFGSMIEGVAVNKKGDVYAVDYRGSGQTNAAAFGLFHQVDGGIANVLSDENPFFVARNGTRGAPLLAGARFVAGGEKVLITDATNHRVYQVGHDARTADIFCANKRMLQPNDLALSPLQDDLIYLSGMKYTANTTAGISGELWSCARGRASRFDPSILAAADIHRTNGIETSPDGATLYLSSAKNVGGEVVSNKIFKFALDPKTGALLHQTPVLFHDFVDSAATDIDGMRTDTDGNLFVTRNGDAKIVKFSPSGEILLVIDVPGMGMGPSNLEFGGPEGKTLFSVGICAPPNDSIGCAASFETDSVGKAFQQLQDSESSDD